MRATKTAGGGGVAAETELAKLMKAITEHDPTGRSIYQIMQSVIWDRPKKVTPDDDPSPTDSGSDNEEEEEEEEEKKEKEKENKRIKEEQRRTIEKESVSPRRIGLRSQVKLAKSDDKDEKGSLLKNKLSRPRRQRAISTAQTNATTITTRLPIKGRDHQKSIVDDDNFDETEETASHDENVNKIKSKKATSVKDEGEDVDPNDAKNHTVNSERVKEQTEGQAEESIEGQVERQVEKPVEEPIEESIKKPVQKPMKELTDEAVDRLIKDLADKLIKGRPMEEPMEEPMEKPMEEPMEEPMKEPMEEPIKKPIKKPMEEPVKKPMEEQVKRKTVNTVDTDEGKSEGEDEDKHVVIEAILTATRPVHVVDVVPGSKRGRGKESSRIRLPSKRVKTVARKSILLYNDDDDDDDDEDASEVELPPPRPGVGRALRPTAERERALIRGDETGLSGPRGLGRGGTAAGRGTARPVKKPRHQSYVSDGPLE